MAFFEQTRSGTGFAAYISQLQHQLREHRRRQAAYRRTYDELIRLDDRDLADLGISRADIPDIAREAALKA